MMPSQALPDDIVHLIDEFVFGSRTRRCRSLTARKRVCERRASADSRYFCAQHAALRESASAEAAVNTPGAPFAGLAMRFYGVASAPALRS